MYVGVKSAEHMSSPRAAPAHQVSRGLFPGFRTRGLSNEDAPQIFDSERR